MDARPAQPQSLLGGGPLKDWGFFIPKPLFFLKLCNRAPVSADIKGEGLISSKWHLMEIFP